MSETPPTGDHDDSATEDELRQHTQEPAEGADEGAREEPDVPRVHSEDPAEG
jgi:hypothetical protein